MNVSRFSDLKPCRDLIDPNFGGYKLSLDSMPVYSLRLTSGVLARAYLLSLYAAYFASMSTATAR